MHLHLPHHHSMKGVTIFTKMTQLAHEYDAINLAQGFPDYPVDEQLLQIFAECVSQQAYHQYAPMSGWPALKEQISIQKSIAYQIPIHPDHITITPGATYGIFISLSAVLDRGDEVIIFEPVYDSYIPAIEMNGGIPVPIALKLPDFQVNWDELTTKISDRTKAIIVNTPNNPTGKIWTQGDWETLANIIQDKNIFVISDEVYDQIVFDEHKHHSVLQIPSLQDRCIAIYSFGKHLHATGWKVGYTIANSIIAQAIHQVHQYTAFSVNTPTQITIAKYLQQNINNCNSIYLENKRNLLLKLLKDSPLQALQATQGTYFQLFDYSQWSDVNDMEFAEWMTKKVGVASIPLSSFYTVKNDLKLIRLCFAKKDETLIEAANRINSFQL